MVDEQFGRYRLRGLLGQGGMGQVYRGYDTQLGRDVAIKVLTPAAASDPTFEQRFRREARTAASLGEPHVVPIFDSGEINGRLFIAMQLIDGTDLATLLSQHGPLPPARAVHFIAQAAAALDAAHRAGLVHRDIKPANLLVTPADFVYLIDFGIAHTTGATHLTNTGATIGTIAYLAPERLTTGHTDHRADIYALTCVLHQCLTGQTPYPAISLEQQMFAHINGPTPQPSTSGAPATFDQVIATGMAQNPNHRYQTAGELATAARTALTAPTPIAKPAPKPAPKPKPAPVRVPATNSTHTRTESDSAPTQLANTPAATPSHPAKRSTPRRRIAMITCAAVTAMAVTATAGHYWINREAATIAVGKRPTGIAIDPTTHRAYITNSAESPGTVSVLDTTTNRVIETIIVGKAPGAVAIEPLTHTAYVTNRAGRSVSVIDTTTNIVTNIPVAFPNDVAVDPASHTAYVTSGDVSSVTVIDTTTTNVTGNIPVSSATIGTAVDSGTRTAYFTVGDNTLEVVDTATQTHSATIDVGQDTRHVDVDSTTHTAYVTSWVSPSDPGLVSVIDTRTNTVTTTIQVGNMPEGLAVDADAHAVYVANSNLHWAGGDDTGGTVSVIDTRTNTVTDTIKVGKDPAGIAVDPSTHTVYVTNTGDDTISVIKPAR